ncbi:MAG TPA: hypothetical protein VJT73_13220 [Polyangiaceae bacterium]|nr:hypothetical protein [Polyangiaceae bacterium]
MSECAERAVLLVTITPMGTSTNVARRRVELRCHLTLGHVGAHQDTQHGETWEALPGRTSTLLRQDEDDEC